MVSMCSVYNNREKKKDLGFLCVCLCKWSGDNKWRKTTITNENGGGENWLGEIRSDRVTHTREKRSFIMSKLNSTPSFLFVASKNTLSIPFDLAYNALGSAHENVQSPPIRALCMLVEEAKPRPLVVVRGRWWVCVVCMCVREWEKVGCWLVRETKKNHQVKSHTPLLSSLIHKHNVRACYARRLGKPSPPTDHTVYTDKGLW